MQKINGPRSVPHYALTAYTQMLILIYRISKNKNSFRLVGLFVFSFFFFLPGHYYQIIICLQLKHALAGLAGGDIS